MVIRERMSRKSTKGFLDMSYSFQGSRCGSGIEPRSMNNDTKHLAGRDWPAGDNSIKKTLFLADAKSLPPLRKEIRLRTQIIRVGEKEKSPALFQLLTGRNHPFHPFGIGCDGQHAETLPAKFIFVKILCPGCFVGEQLALKTGLAQIAARDGHGGAVGFKTIPAAFTVALQTKNPVGNDPALAADVHAPLKWAHLAFLRQQ